MAPLETTGGAAPPVAPGSSAPLGASLQPGGVNFSIYARDATLVELCLFDAEAADEPSQVIPLAPDQHRTIHYWHALVGGLKAGQIYGYKVHGPFAPEQGMRFDPGRLLLDPYGLAVVMPPGYSRRQGGQAGSAMATAMKSVVADLDAYDWEGDRPLQRPSSEAVIYEMHVRGFTCHPSSGVAPDRAGTYAGLIEKIPYLQTLGITAVELMPVFHFDPCDAPDGLVNYWGYQPVSFFAPHRPYSSRQDPLGPLDEFRDLVKALHRANIEVILDVVFNHTAEGAADGPTFCFRGLANADYYLLEADRSRYLDVTGTGNTLNANHPVVRRLIRHSLRHWVQHMHVDGFRFDLAAVLSRDETGQPMPLPPILFDIDTDPVLAGTKLIAEAWDAAGLYEVGQFVGDSWREWNGRFRDDVRRFLKSDPAMVPALAQRLTGSPDLYGHKRREAEASINFVTCHDGFTLADLVSHDHKHNDANGEQGRDGSDDNASWNGGVEGPSNDPAIAALRQRQSRNFLTLLLLSIGTPMLLMGDEVGRSQQGNNNAYGQDNAISWFDWTLVERHGDLLRFVQELIAFRLHRDVVSDAEEISLAGLLRESQITWHGVELHQPDWSDASRSLAVTVTSLHGRFRLHALFNAYWEPLSFAIPAGAEGPAGTWGRWIDTARPGPEAITGFDAPEPIQGDRCRVEARSTCVLVERLPQGDETRGGLS
ncbi:MAG: glycogen debranching protein GlgX [Cyanobium sp. CZS 25K]|nr:glycogen debranching protein GlgX [Cyanobium sp. CZS25K]